MTPVLSAISYRGFAISAPGDRPGRRAGDDPAPVQRRWARAAGATALARRRAPPLG